MTAINQLNLRKDPPPSLLLLAMPLSCYTSCSHAVKNTLWSKDDTDNLTTLFQPRKDFSTHYFSSLSSPKFIYSLVWFACRIKWRICRYNWLDRLSVKLPAKGQLLVYLANAKETVGLMNINIVCIRPNWMIQLLIHKYIGCIKICILPYYIVDEKQYVKRVVCPNSQYSSPWITCNFWRDSGVCIQLTPWGHERGFVKWLNWRR